MKNLSFFLTKFKIAKTKKSNIIVLAYNIRWLSLLKLLYNEGFIQNYIVKKNKLFIYLRYYMGTCNIRYIKNFSKPTKTLYLKRKNLWLFQRYNGSLILSTIYGLKTHEECLKHNLGGKVLFFIG